MMVCPRCGLGVHDTLEQVERCAYCAHNFERIRHGLPVLPEPTDKYPAGRKAPNQS